MWSWLPIQAQISWCEICGELSFGISFHSCDAGLIARDARYTLANTLLFNSILRCEARSLRCEIVSSCLLGFFTHQNVCDGYATSIIGDKLVKSIAVTELSSSCGFQWLQDFLASFVLSWFFERFRYKTRLKQS